MLRLTVPLAAVFVAAMAAPAAAHVGHGADATLAGGLMHPLSGVDHLLAAFAVGLWAMLSDARRPLIWPLTFLGAMSLSAIAAAHGYALPLLEPAIAASVVALGLGIALRLRAQTVIGALAIGGFAIVHGQAHGLEGGAAPAYLAGLIGSTALLHALGMAAGAAALKIERPVLARSAGAAIAVAGVALLAV